MRIRSLLGAFSAASLLAAVACNPSPPTVEKKSETSQQTTEGTVSTSTESTQVGATTVSKTETKSDTGSGTATAKIDTYVGTVTIYTPGKKIEVMTGEKKTESFDLDSKDTTANVDAAVKVGSRVKLVQEKTDKGTTITVKTES